MVALSVSSSRRSLILVTIAFATEDRETSPDSMFSPSEEGCLRGHLICRSKENGCRFF